MSAAFTTRPSSLDIPDTTEGSLCKSIILYIMDAKPSAIVMISIRRFVSRLTIEKDFFSERLYKAVNMPSLPTEQVGGAAEWALYGAIYTYAKRNTLSPYMCLNMVDLVAAIGHERNIDYSEFINNLGGVCAKDKDVVDFFEDAPRYFCDKDFPPKFPEDSCDKDFPEFAKDSCNEKFPEDTPGDSCDKDFPGFAKDSCNENFPEDSCNPKFFDEDFSGFGEEFDVVDDMFIPKDMFKFCCDMIIPKEDTFYALFNKIWCVLIYIFFIPSIVIYFLGTVLNIVLEIILFGYKEEDNDEYDFTPTDDEDDKDEENVESDDECENLAKCDDDANSDSESDYNRFLTDDESDDEM